jgi:hypothetical protein
MDDTVVINTRIMVELCLLHDHANCATIVINIICSIHAVYTCAQCQYDLAGLSDLL